jgi:hypothetical protein
VTAAAGAAERRPAPPRPRTTLAHTDAQLRWALLRARVTHTRGVPRATTSNMPSSQSLSTAPWRSAHTTLMFTQDDAAPPHARGCSPRNSDGSRRSSDGSCAASTSSACRATTLARCATMSSGSAAGSPVITAAGRGLAATAGGRHGALTATPPPSCATGSPRVSMKASSGSTSAYTHSHYTHSATKEHPAPRETRHKLGGTTPFVKLKVQIRCPFALQIAAVRRTRS